MAGRAAAAAACALLASTPAPAAEKKTAPSTQEMAATLADLGSKVNAANLPFVVNDRRAAHFAEELTFPRRIAERLHLRVMYARELLNAGQIEELPAGDRRRRRGREGERAARLAGAAARPAAAARARLHAPRRGAELPSRRTRRDSCLLPIRGQGVHKRREGSARAIEILDALPARRSPTTCSARWLLNIAHMTLGT